MFDIQRESGCTFIDQVSLARTRCWSALKQPCHIKFSWCNVTHSIYKTTDSTAHDIHMQIESIRTEGGLSEQTGAMGIFYARLSFRYYETGSINQESSGAPSPKWRLLKWWIRLRTTSGRTPPCLRGRSETGCWPRASVTETPCPASAPSTGNDPWPHPHPWLTPKLTRCFLLLKDYTHKSSTAIQPSSGQQRPQSWTHAE